MTKAAETVAWFACGGDRDDYQCDWRTPRLILLWIGWEIATQGMRALRSTRAARALAG